MTALPLINDDDGDNILRFLKDEPLTTARMDHMLGNWGSGKTESALERLHSYGYVQCEGNNRYYSLWSLTGKGKEAAA